jgi:hypothetical protein
MAIPEGGSQTACKKLGPGLGKPSQSITAVFLQWYRERDTRPSLFLRPPTELRQGILFPSVEIEELIHISKINRRCHTRAWGGKQFLANLMVVRRR